MERHGRALTDATIALELRPNSYKALRTQARVRLAQGYYEDAITIFKSALQACSSEENAVTDQKAIEGELKQAEAKLARRETKNYYEILK